jgi:hypothetical protein
MSLAEALKTPKAKEKKQAVKPDLVQAALKAYKDADSKGEEVSATKAFRAAVLATLADVEEA